METFTAPIKMVEDSGFAHKRMQVLKGLTPGMIDPQILDVVQGFSRLPHAYTVQSCYGHLVHDGQAGRDAVMIDPGPDLPETGLYQIAYLAMVIENSGPGREFYERLAEIPKLNEKFYQWGSGTWFWENQGYLNSYVLQVEPIRFKHLDRFTMDRREAGEWLEARADFWGALRGLLGLRTSGGATGEKFKVQDA